MSVWDSLTGSSSARALERQVAGNEVAHSWLLLGPSGSGKSSAAIAMAAALNCEVEPGKGCGRCSACERILRRRFPDVHHIQPEGPLIPVDVIRESVIPQTSRSAFEGRTKVFVIEEADRMNEPAQNALLKTLEEPHDDTVFILISDDEEEVLETIQSRCRIVRLEPLPEDDLVQVMVAGGASDDEARLAARVSHGDVDRAQALVQEKESSLRRSLWRSVPARLTSPTDALDAAAEILDTARSAVKARERQQKKEITELADAMGEGRGTARARNALATRHKRELRRLEEEILGEALDAIASFYRDVVALRSGGPDTAINLDSLEDLRAWAESESPDIWLLMGAERCIAARAALPKNANQTLAIESCLLHLTRLLAPPAAVRA
jgi:DNA polymerase III subunit delta'